MGSIVCIVIAVLGGGGYLWGRIRGTANHETGDDIEVGGAYFLVLFALFLASIFLIIPIVGKWMVTLWPNGGMLLAFLLIFATIYIIFFLTEKIIFGKKKKKVN